MTTTIVITPIEFDGTEIELHGEAFHRFVRVKRLRGGESVRVVDGEGRARRGVVARLDRARAVVALAGAEPSREPRLQLELVVAPPEPARAAWLVEKATELGAVAVRFVITERSFGGGAGGRAGGGAGDGAREDTGYSANQLARLRRVAHAAVEQCGRARVPEIGALEPVNARMASDLPLLDGLGDASDVLRVVFDPSGAPAASLLPLDEARCPSLRAAFFVGPEGGWSEAELAGFDAVGAKRLELGERILRVETAAVVAAALALSAFSPTRLGTKPD